MTPFATMLTPLSYIPVLFGMLFGAWGCLTIVLRWYGMDLEIAVPQISSGQGLEAPVLLAGVAAFGFVQGAIIRNRKTERNSEFKQRFGPMGWLERLAILAAVLTIVTVPYWWQLPFPEVWVAAIGIGSWLVWRKFCR